MPTGEGMPSRKEPQNESTAQAIAARVARIRARAGLDSPIHHRGLPMPEEQAPHSLEEGDIEAILQDAHAQELRHDAAVRDAHDRHSLPDY